MKAHAPSLLKCAEPRWPVLLPCSALQNDLSNRLRPDPGIGTAAVLLSDDDLLLRCACLTCTKWQLSGVCGARCCLPAAFCRVQPQQQQWCSTLPPAPTPPRPPCRCADVERAFARWQANQQALVGFFPRLGTPGPPPQVRILCLQQWLAGGPCLPS
jgi:hypothetical protein